MIMNHKIPTYKREYYIFECQKRETFSEKRDTFISKGIVIYIWLSHLAFGELKSSQVLQNGEHNIGSSANPVVVHRNVLKTMRFCN